MGHSYLPALVILWHMSHATGMQASGIDAEVSVCES